jgi:hypothetical protein
LLPVTTFLEFVDVKPNLVSTIHEIVVDLLGYSGKLIPTVAQENSQWNKFLGWRPLVVTRITLPKTTFGFKANIVRFAAWAVSRFHF